MRLTFAHLMASSRCRRSNWYKLCRLKRERLDAWQLPASPRPVEPLSEGQGGGTQTTPVRGDQVRGCQAEGCRKLALPQRWDIQGTPEPDGQTASLAAHSVLERCLGRTAVTLPLAVPLCLDLALTGPLLGSSFQVVQEGRAAGGPSVAQPPPSAPISGAGWEPHISAGAEPALKGGGILLGTLGLPEGDPGALEPKSRLSGLGRSCPPHREGGNALSFLSQRISAHWAPEYSDFNPINCAQWSSEQIPAGGISDFTHESHCGLVGAPEDEEVLSVWRESEDVDLVPACSPWARASVPRGLDPCLTNVSADWGPSGHP